MALNIGDRAPDFEAHTDSGAKIRLSEILMNREVVLYFYPKDETPGCTAEACSFRDHWDDIKELGAEVIGVSSDSEDSHKKFKDHHKLQFTLVSDPNKEIRRMYDVKGSILPPRTTFVISKDGKIIHVYNSQMNAKHHVDEAIYALKKMHEGTDKPASQQ